MSARRSFKDFLAILDRVERLTVIAFFLLMVGVTVLGIFLRYVFGWSLSWGQEFAQLCFIWVTLLGASIGAKRGQLIRVESFLVFFRAKAIPYLQISINVCITAFLFFLVRQSFQLVQLNWTSLLPALRWSVSSISLSILVASVLMLLHYLLLTAAALKNLLREK